MTVYRIRTKKTIKMFNIFYDSRRYLLEALRMCYNEARDQEHQAQSAKETNTRKPRESERETGRRRSFMKNNRKHANPVKIYQRIPKKLKKKLSKTLGQKIARTGAKKASNMLVKKIVKVLTATMVLGILLCGCTADVGENREPQHGGKPTDVGQHTVQAKALAVYPEEPEFRNTDESWEYYRAKRQAHPDAFVNRYEAFAVRTSAKLLGEAQENTVYSPLSLYYALSLAASGAESETGAEMLSLLGYEDAEALKADCKASFEWLYHVTNEANNRPNEYGEYDRESRYRLQIANSLWADHSFDMKDAFAEDGAESFYADVYQADLQSPETQEAKAAWVEERTNGLIRPSVTPANDQAVLAILNTIYFYDEWINRFNEEKTAEDVFTCADGTEVTCDFMNMQMGSHGFRKGENYTESSLGLKNGEMNFYLPDEGVDVRELVKDTDTLAAILSGDGLEYQSGEVTWKVPKFSHGSNLNLAAMLQVLGVEQAFGGDADFGGISDAKPLFLSSVIQDTHLGIDEEGVEGAAYTEIMLAGGAMPTGRAEMILDRPFLYTVENKGVIVFIGICGNPAES